MPPDVVLRPLTPTDGPAVAELCERSPDTGRVSFSFRYQRDAYQVLWALKPNSLGVVAERPGRAELLGLGTVSFGQGCGSFSTTEGCQKSTRYSV